MNTKQLIQSAVEGNTYALARTLFGRTTTITIDRDTRDHDTIIVQIDKSSGTTTHHYYNSDSKLFHLLNNAIADGFKAEDDSPIEIMSIYYRSVFRIDSSEHTYFGYMNGQVWNGFAMPLFDKQTAMNVLADCGSDPTWRYDKKSDSFILRFKDCTEIESGECDEIYSAQWIVVDGKRKKVYGIGSGSWVWESLLED